MWTKTRGPGKHSKALALLNFGDLFRKRIIEAESGAQHNHLR